MGKQRKQKVHKAKVHPTGVQSMHEAERMLEAAGEIVNEVSWCKFHCFWF